MLDIEFTEALASVICDSGITDKVRGLRINGVRQLKSITAHYTSDGFVERLCEEVWRQKIDFILNAKSKNEIESIIKPSTPRYYGGTFSPCSQYHSEAEELILWSAASLRGPLISDGFARYMELFGKYFPENHEALHKPCA